MIESEIVSDGDTVIAIEGRRFAIRQAKEGYWYFLPLDPLDKLFGNSRVRRTRHKYRCRAIRSLKGYIARGG